MLCTEVLGAEYWVQYSSEVLSEVFLISQQFSLPPLRFSDRKQRQIGSEGKGKKGFPREGIIWHHCYTDITNWMEKYQEIISLKRNHLASCIVTQILQIGWKNAKKSFPWKGIIWHHCYTDITNRMEKYQDFFQK